MFRGENQWRDIMQVIMRFQGFEPSIRRLVRREIVKQRGTFFHFAEEMVENMEDLLVFRATSVSSFFSSMPNPGLPSSLWTCLFLGRSLDKGNVKKV